MEIVEVSTAILRIISERICCDMKTVLAQKGYFIGASIDPQKQASFVIAAPLNHTGKKKTKINIIPNWDTFSGSENV